ncbi:MAG TPA: hypothetical protein PLS71_25840 [Leptospiraceae bacterium]|nr:hypothetical protein [Leptospiraceae bacterium]
MQNPFEIKGYWWLPELEEIKLPGILTFSQEDGASLEIVGVFDLKKPEPIKQPSIILGVTQQGKPITLYKCVVTAWTYPIVGLGSGGGRYRAHFVFEGVHFTQDKKIKFNKLCGSYTDLDAWVGIYGFDINWDNSDEKVITNIRYEKPKSLFFDIGEDFEVGINFSSQGPKKSIIQTEATITQQAYLFVKSKNSEIGFEDMFVKLNTFTYLVQFAIQRIPYPLRVFGFSKENQEELSEDKFFYPEINIYYAPVEPITNQKEKLPQEFLYTFKDLSANQISLWFTSFQKHETIIHLYRSLFYSNRLFIDTKFLYITQSLESLHSALFNGQYLPHDKFVEQKERALQGIPSELSEWVEDALSNANYKRLRQKLFELFENKKDIIEQFVDDIELFAKRVTSTRNEFVHHSKQKWTFQKEELPSAIYKLTMVFEMYLLEIIGFSSEQIIDLLEPKLKTHLTGWKHLRTKRKS